uniref:non-specific serine/threonine protein kinase n=2 Tax=Steinernema glaseri TaxID=37863 RepID=A0A1I7Y6Q3_9BILA
MGTSKTSSGLWDECESGRESSVGEATHLIHCTYGLEVVLLIPRMEEAEELLQELLDCRSNGGVDALLDAITALTIDCNYPLLRQQRNIDSFLSRYERWVKKLNAHRVKVSDFDVLKTIGRGAYGEVQLVRKRSNKNLYAMKLLNKQEMLEEIKSKNSAFYWHERDIMAHTDSEWIVRLHYAFQDARYLYMVMEYLPGGDLASFLLSNDVSEEAARFFVAELVLALDVIHRSGYLHRDVKPDNLLIAASGHVKLADFGTCLRFGDDGFVRCCIAVGTPDYISPEALTTNGTEGVYGRELDWWSVGVVLYELLVGTAPFYDDSIMQCYWKIQNHATSLSFPGDVAISDNAKDLIRKLLAEKTLRLGREGVDEIKKHPFFRNDQWTFDTIAQATAPVIPHLESDDDTSYFYDVDEGSPKPEAFHIPKTFVGSHLPFIGFTYSNDLSPSEAIVRKISTNSVGLLESDNHEHFAKELRSQLQEENAEVAKELEAAKLALEEKDVEILERDSEIEEMSSEMERLRKENEALVNSEAALKKDLEEATNRSNDVEKLKGQLRRSEGEALKMEVDLLEEREKNEKLSERVAEIQAELEERKASEESLRKKIADLQDQLSRREETKENMEKPKEPNGDMHKMRWKAVLMLGQMLRLSSENVNIKGDNVELKKQLKVLKSKEENPMRRRTISDANIWNRKLEFTVMDLEEQLQTEQGFINLYKNEIESMENDVNDIQQRFLDAQETIEKLRSELLVQRTLKAQMETELKQAEKDKTMMEVELRQTLQRHSKEMTTKESRIDELSRKEYELLAEIDALKAERQELQDSLPLSVTPSPDTPDSALPSPSSTISMDTVVLLDGPQDKTKSRRSARDGLLRIEETMKSVREWKSTSLSRDSGVLSPSRDGGFFSADILSLLPIEKRCFVRTSQTKRKFKWTPVILRICENRVTLRRESNDIHAVISARNLLHVRSVTAADVRFARASEIPTIFQILYRTTEVETTRRGLNTIPSVPFSIESRNHLLVELTYHVSATCDLCRGQLSHLFHPCPAVECKRCRMKFHSAHRDRNELPYCRISPQENENASAEMLLRCEDERSSTYLMNHLNAYIQMHSSRTEALRRKMPGSVAGRIRPKSTLIESQII